MRVLRIKADNLPLFKGSIEIDFTARQRVNDEDSQNMHRVFANIYQNNALAVTGINASGKTTVLKVLSFVIQMLRDTPLNNISCIEILDGISENDIVKLEIYFCDTTDEIYYLNTEIAKNGDRYIILNETLKSKSVTKSPVKKSLFDFEKAKIVLERNSKEDFLLDDVSIIVAYNEKYGSKPFLRDTLNHTNKNVLDVKGELPEYIIKFFDPNIEKLTINKLTKGYDIRLKFKDQDELCLIGLPELNRYLSSGTIKGINIFSDAIRTFNEGGYLIVDELENHFNQEIVSILIRFYMDTRINTTGAVLIFSTHYSELLDIFERNDCIYLTRNSGGITSDNYAELLKRNDIKKSDAYQSGYLGGTAPMYDSYMELKNILVKASKERK